MFLVIFYDSHNIKFTVTNSQFKLRKLYKKFLYNLRFNYEKRKKKEENKC